MLLPELNCLHIRAVLHVHVHELRYLAGISVAKEDDKLFRVRAAADFQHKPEGTQRIHIVRH